MFSQPRVHSYQWNGGGNQSSHELPGESKCQVPGKDLCLDPLLDYMGRNHKSIDPPGVCVAVFPQTPLEMVLLLTTSNCKRKNQITQLNCWVRGISQGSVKLSALPFSCLSQQLPAFVCSHICPGKWFTKRSFKNYFSLSLLKRLTYTS